MRIVATLLLLSLGACTTHVSGLMPIEPAPDNSRTDTIQPLLRWEPMPGGEDPRISELVYDVQVLHASGWVFVERTGLTACEFRVEPPLAYNQTYRWTVRARFRWEGRRRQTEWSRLTDPNERLGILTMLPARYLPFRTPAAPEAKAAASRP